MKFTIVLLGAIVAACSYTATVETKCYRDGDLAYVQETVATSNSTGFGSAQSASSSKVTYTADWYDPAKHTVELTCVSNTKMN